MFELIVSDNYKSLTKYVDERIINRMHSNRNACCRLENGLIMWFHLFDIKNNEKSENSIHIYYTSDNLIFLTDSNMAIKILKHIDNNKSGAENLFDFFTELTSNDLYSLEEFENVISSIESSLLTSKRVDGKKLRLIMKYKNKLLRIKRYYEQLEMIMDSIIENADITKEEKYIKDHFKILEKRMEKLLNFVLNLREYITQVREAYQSQIDIEQNDIMRIFTVITTIFLPLTLIVGWYGMNLKMPEFSWNYGYPFVIVLSLLVCLICFVIFKLKKWF